jgi:ADP-heptose:LPS heptosyltransferase
VGHVRRNATAENRRLRPVNIIAFQFNKLGDNIAFVPAIQALRQRCRDCHITILTTPASAELYMGPLGPQEVIVGTKRGFEKSYRRPWNLALWMWRVRRQHPDACLVSFDQGSVALLAAKLSGAGIRIGGKLECARIKGALTEEIPIPEDSRPVTWHWRMARALAKSCGGDEEWPEDSPPPDLRHLLSRGARPKGSRRRVVIHSGASRYLNQWPSENFASVAKSLSGDFDVVWITHGGTTGAAPPGIFGAQVNSLSEFAEWLASADLFVGNNSGPMHLADALGCAGVAVTGPSARGWDPYWYRDRWSVLRHPNLYCAPCEMLSEELAGCTNLDSPMACLKYWTIERVNEECRNRLESRVG